MFWCLVLMLASLPAPGTGNREPGAGQPELIERTLAIVGGQPITLSDARAAVAFGLVETEQGPDPIPGATARLIDRELILREVQRYAPPAPDPAAVDARIADVRQRFPEAGSFERVLERHGFSLDRLRAWLRDDLRAQAYLAQRFASASMPADAEIAAAYALRRAEFDRQGMTFEQARSMLRDQVVASRRRELITDWLSDLRRRTEVIILQQ
jgi:hypothetical protein